MTVRVLHCVKSAGLWAYRSKCGEYGGTSYKPNRHDFGTPEAAKKFARENWGRYVKVTVRK